MLCLVNERNVHGTRHTHGTRAVPESTIGLPSQQVAESARTTWKKENNGTNASRVESSRVESELGPPVALSRPGGAVHRDRPRAKASGCATARDGRAKRAGPCKAAARKGGTGEGKLIIRTYKESGIEALAGGKKKTRLLDPCCGRVR